MNEKPNPIGLIFCQPQTTQHTQQTNLSPKLIYVAIEKGNETHAPGSFI